MKIITNTFNYKIDKIKKILLNNLNKDETIKFYNCSLVVDHRIKDCKKILNKTIKNKRLPRDIIGFRIIFDHENTSISYNIIRNIELNYNIIPNTFKDYIVNKKNNDYMSLHICAMIEHVMVEIQVRNNDMDYSANYGKASNYH
tara:strand:- start:331 stop:762 length:432 start_codon:yes stop_codon:yes gene_type:complete